MRTLHKLPTTPGRCGLREPRRSKAGIMLVECLVYMSVLAVIFGLAFSAFYHCQSQSNQLRRNAQDIALAMRAGERWRADIRAAAAPPRWEAAGETQVLVIPRAGGQETLYAFADKQVLVKTGGATNWTVLLPSVKSSRMRPENRAAVSAWRWELELQTRQKTVRLPPLFTFLAVAPKPPAP